MRCSGLFLAPQFQRDPLIETFKLKLVTNPPISQAKNRDFKPKTL